MSKSWCSALPGGVRLAVQISANATKTQVVGAIDAVLKIKLQAQPIEGKANSALILYLAQTLGLPKSAVTLTHGHANTLKLLSISAASLTPEAVMRRLLDAAGQ